MRAQRDQSLDIKTLSYPGVIKLSASKGGCL